MVRNNVHRVAVLNDDQTLHSVLSESKLIQFIAPMASEAVMGRAATTQISKYELGYKTVLAIHQDRIMLDALTEMYDECISSVAIVDTSGALMGTVTASVMKEYGMFWIARYMVHLLNENHLALRLGKPDLAISQYAITPIPSR